MPRAGIGPERITRAASAICDQDGAAAVTVARLAADLGVAAPSLYKHVAGRDEVMARVAAEATRMLADTLLDAVAGRSGFDALERLAWAYRRFSSEHPGLYRLSQTAVPAGEGARQAEAGRAVDVVAAALVGYGLPDESMIDAIRLTRSALHGFADLECQGGFGLPHSRDDSFRVLVAALDTALRGLAAGS
ncbi:Bacterial regulatory proteins, tetR family [Arthrobacter saudimassiliensis]|uniref:Bacterial regulatory proteins, tetR family n=1 Tax=Arthrobacter saudimassiliensis TaxID=1461584 RepID=A0A078MRY8_9MICC|nr:Bacterial regulatory proteins, tetR family [Arthrobacter saudimassiliensis]